VRFIVDQQLSRRLCDVIRNAGGDCVHVKQAGLNGAADSLIWRRAVAEGLIVVSKDADFADLARRTGAARTVWIRIGNCSNADLVARAARVWPEVLVQLEAGQMLVELA
jgi:predicted nuclease of predicted toxin-antitoxin system